jgi:hypothetical protein
VGDSDRVLIGMGTGTRRYPAHSQGDALMPGDAYVSIVAYAYLGGVEMWAWGDI